jgi:hypothetical protein
MINQKRIEKSPVKNEIEINLDNELRSDNDIIDSATINLSRDLLNDLMKGKQYGNRIKLTGTFISFQMFINDIIEKSKPDNNPSGSYGSPFVK